MMTKLTKFSNGRYGFQDKFLWFWLDRTAKDDNGNDLPCLLVGFNTIEEAMANAQSDYLIDRNCIDDIIRLNNDN